MGRLFRSGTRLFLGDLEFALGEPASLLPDMKAVFLGDFPGAQILCRQREVPAKSRVDQAVHSIGMPGVPTVPLQAFHDDYWIITTEPRCGPIS